MNQVKKRIGRGLALLLAVLQVMLVFAVVPVSAADDVETSGTCGENLTWTLDDGGTLTISGTGAMTDYDTSDSMPWYSSRTTIQSIIIEDGVTTIALKAFCYCSNLSSVTIPASVTTIGDSAFYDCSRLSTIELPDGVTTIGKSAFSGCSSLSSIELPNSIMTIDEQAFLCCSSLNSIELPNSITCISSFMFYNCPKLNSVLIPLSVTKIGSGAFRACENLENVYYGGFEENWSNIYIGEMNDPLRNATIHYNSIGLDEGEYDSPQTSVWYQVWGSGDRDYYTGDVTLQVGEQTYTQKAKAGTRLSANIPVSDASKVSISKEGYFTCKIPRELVYQCNGVVLVPEDEKNRLFSLRQLEEMA